MRCVLAGKADSHRSLTDILITNGDGAPVVELRGVSTFGYGEKKSSASTTARA